jgi:uncharacterized membrane protein
VLSVRAAGPMRGASFKSALLALVRMLEERFARGKIDRQEFEERRRTLLS